MTEEIAPKIYDIAVRRVADFGNETRHFELAFEGGQSMDFLPGQFVSVLCPANGKPIRRAYSIASPPFFKSRIDLCLKLVYGGTVTHWLWNLKEGERFQIHGPMGKFVLPEPVDFDVVFVATGTGIAPFRSMIHTLLEGGFQKKVWLLFGVRYDGAIPYHAEWLELAARHPGFVYIPTISRPSPEWTGEAGYVQTKIAKYFSEPAGKRVYVCGLSEMIRGVEDACLNGGFGAEDIRYERYD
jgi:ferredoxin-NADP reductase